MNEQQFDRLLKLIKKTNDKLVVLDRGTDSATVMMPIDDYEKLIGADDDAWWEGLPKGGGEPPLPPEPDIEEPDSSADLSAEVLAEVEAPSETDGSKAEDLFTKVHEAEKIDERESHGTLPNPETSPKLEFSPNWASENSAPISTEDLSDVPEEEEKFYLEPVE